ncbi:hypothetical protein VTN77DRAFT_7252 [Rasamsonia byssochlamydoides]|uniref:uncharacterized protein n=1 Tax=Rasamsonia byssochlamydoides TaxID=89139 RepID=UPI0037428C10
MSSDRVPQVDSEGDGDGEGAEGLRTQDHEIGKGEAMFGYGVGDSLGLGRVKINMDDGRPEKQPALSLFGERSRWRISLA